MGTGSSAIEKTKLLGNQYFAQGEYKKAIATYSKAIRYDPSNCFLLSNRSACYLKINNLKDALEDAICGIASAPKWNKSYFRLASVLQACGLNSESLYFYEISMGIQDDPTIYKRCEELKTLVKFRGRSTVLLWGPSHPRPVSLKSLEGVQISEM